MQKYNSPYEEQWNRVLRLRKRLDQFLIADDKNFEEAIDAFTNFFIQSYHMRDWLIKSGYDQVAIDEHIRRDRWLSVCRDLANKQKHQTITRYKPKNSFVDHGVGVSTPISRYYNPVERQSHFGINIWELQMPLDAIDAATLSVAGWCKVIQMNRPFDI